MDCKEFQELLPDLAAGMEASTPGVEKHLAFCAACSAKLQEFQKTMALLDEWQAPEPSPYFDTRLHARMREADTEPLRSRLFYWLSWRWKPALAAVLAIALVVGVRTYQVMNIPPVMAKGSAVSDLQNLDNNSDVYDTDLFDDDSDQNNDQ